MQKLNFQEPADDKGKRSILLEYRSWFLRVLILWILLMAVIANSVYHWWDAGNKKIREDALVSMCNQRALILQNGFNDSVNNIHTLAFLINTFHFQNSCHFDQETFSDITRITASERPLMTGVAYSERVIKSKRVEFEEAHGWTIKTMQGENQTDQDEYAPVIFFQDTLSHIQHMDMMSSKEDEENIKRAKDTGKAVLTRPFKLLKSKHIGVIITLPVYKMTLQPDTSDSERMEATAGYLGGAFDVNSLVEQLFQYLDGNEAIVVNVYDVTDKSEPLFMYWNTEEYGDASFSYTCMLDIGASYRRYQMECRYRSKVRISSEALSIALLTFFIGFVIGHIAYHVVMHVIRVEDDFIKMQELKVLAEAADVAKSRFLATVSHEIRTPMSGILGMLGFILDTELNTKQREYSETARDCGKAVISLVNDVLDREKIEAGKLELGAVPFDIRSVLDDVVSLFSEASMSKGIELVVFVFANVPETVVGDPGKFRQIITNLVGNSVKFTERGHVFVRVCCAENERILAGWNSASDGGKLETLSGYEAADDRNSWDKFKRMLDYDKAIGDGDKITLMVSVEDTGTGIPSHAQGRVFAPFVQADSSISRNYGGTGIGLRISKCLVELMGGEISFVTRPEIGTTFTFTADFKKCGETVEVVQPPMEGFTAVIVDPRRVRAEVTKYHLGRLGFRPLLADSVESAYVHVGDVDVILVEKEAWLLDKLRKSSAKFMLLAMKMDPGEIERAKEAGFSDTIVMKPLRKRMMVAWLQHVMGVKPRPEGDRVRRRSNLLHRKKILVVDDNAINRLVASRTLAKLGAEVECANSGRGALLLLQPGHDFDACFMDVQMPEMDGFQATRLIREMEKKAKEEMNWGYFADGGSRYPGQWRVPILAMTADVFQATHEECLKCGMDGCISKPLEEENLYYVVSKVLK